MDFQVLQTTAEHVIGATDAALVKGDGVDADFVAEFLDVPREQAASALGMAEQLTFVRRNAEGLYRASYPFAVYLVTSKQLHKAAILRLVLEQYLPYKTFKARLVATGLLDVAANQTKAAHGLSAHRETITETFKSLGGYARSLDFQGAGLYTVAEDQEVRYLQVVADVVATRESTEVHMRRRLGQETCEWIHDQDVLAQLVSAYQRLGQVSSDTKAPILHAGNAVEAALLQLAHSFNVPMQGANGINGIADKLARAGKLLKKHKFMVKYLGHIRNAADHGPDPETGATWQVSEGTAVEYVHVAMSVVRALLAAKDGTYVV